jgi:hypothetical protein
MSSLKSGKIKKRRHGALNNKTIKEFNKQNNIHKNIANLKL